MSIFNLTDEKMKETSSTFTAHEIYQQPATWRKTCAQLAGSFPRIRGGDPGYNRGNSYANRFSPHTRG